MTRSKQGITSSEEHVIRGKQHVARSVHNQKGSWLTREG